MKKLTLIILVVLLVCAGVVMADSVTENRSVVVIELKANQTVSIRCLQWDEVIVHPTNGQADVTCRVYLGADEQ